MAAGKKAAADNWRSISARATFFSFVQSCRARLYYGPVTPSMEQILQAQALIRSLIRRCRSLSLRIENSLLEWVEGGLRVGWGWLLQAAAIPSGIWWHVTAATHCSIAYEIVLRIFELDWTPSPPPPPVAIPRRIAKSPARIWKNALLILIQILFIYLIDWFFWVQWLVFALATWWVISSTMEKRNNNKKQRKNQTGTINNAFINYDAIATNKCSI